MNKNNKECLLRTTEQYVNHLLRTERNKKVVQAIINNGYQLEDINQEVLTRINSKINELPLITTNTYTLLEISVFKSVLNDFCKTPLTDYNR